MHAWQVVVAERWRAGAELQEAVRELGNDTPGATSTEARAGRKEGRRDEAAAVTLRQLNRRCGPLSEATTAQIQALPLEQLESLAPTPGRRASALPFANLQADSHFWLGWLSAELVVMQVNMLDAKSQLSRLVKAALAGEEVIIASHGKAQVKLVPCAAAAGLKRLGALAAASSELLASQVDAAFGEAVDQQVAELFNS